MVARWATHIQGLPMEWTPIYPLVSAAAHVRLFVGRLERVALPILGAQFDQFVDSYSP